MKFYKLIVFFALLLSISLPTYGMNRRGRLGIGYSNELQNNIPSLSLKLQRNNSFAFGALVNFSNKDTGGGFAAGIKLYKFIFDEPQLNFYAGLLGALIKTNNLGISKTGFQANLALGSEFQFKGLSSLGFSLEFGLSLYSLDQFVIQTIGSSLIGAGVHFYL